MSLSSSSTDQIKRLVVIFLALLPTVVLCYILWTASEYPRTDRPPVITVVTTTVVTTTPVAVCPPEMDCPPMPSLDY